MASAGLALGPAQRLLGAGAGCVGGAECARSAASTAVLRRAARRLAARSTSAISRSRSLRRASTQLAAARRELADLAQGAEPDAPAAGRGDAPEVLGQVLEALHDPRVGEQPRGEREHRGRAAEQLQQGPRTGCGRRARLAATSAGVPGGASSAVAPSGTGAVEQRLARRARPPRRRRRGARRAPPRAPARSRPARAARRSARGGPRPAEPPPASGVAAQELVGRGQLGADPRRLAPRALGLALGLGELAARLLGALVGGRTRLPRGLDRATRVRSTAAAPGARARPRGRRAPRRARARGAPRSARAPPRAPAIRAPRLWSLSPASSPALGALHRRQLGRVALDPPGEALAGGGRLLAAQAEALARGARAVERGRQRVVALGALGERALGLARARRSRPAARSRRRRARRAPSRPAPGPRPAPSAARAARLQSSSQRASSSWRSRRSCSSAASAWRLSGRSRVRASRSTSSARSRFSCVRSSLSCARRRRLRCLPSPAASSISSRRSRGLEVTIASTRPWEMTECVSLPRPVSESTSITSREPAAGAVEAVGALAVAVQAPRRSRSR